MYLVSHDRQRVRGFFFLFPLKAAEEAENLLWRDGTADQILQVVAATSCEGIYSSLKLPSHLQHKDIIKTTCVMIYVGD